MKDNNINYLSSFTLLFPIGNGGIPHYIKTRLYEIEAEDSSSSLLINIGTPKVKVVQPNFATNLPVPETVDIVECIIAQTLEIQVVI